MRKALVVLSVLCLAGAAGATASYQEKRLESFENGSDGWQGGSVETAHATHGQRSFAARFTRQGQGIAWNGKLDLSAWTKLKLDTYNAGDPFIVSFIARDADGKRYRAWYQQVGSGRGRLEYALRGLTTRVADRGKVNALDLSRITGLSLFADGPFTGTRIVHFDNIRVSRGPEPPEPIGTYGPTGAAARRTVAHVPGNLVRNGEFELSLQNWSSWGTWDGGEYKFATGDGANARSGNFSAAIICVRKGRGGIWNKVAVPADGEYRLRFAAKGAGGADTMRFSISGGGPSEDLRVGSQWKLFDRTLRLSKGNKNLYLQHVSGGTLYLDSVSLIPAGASTAAAKQAPAAAKRTPRRVTVRDGRIHVDGEPFFPIGYYGVRDPLTELKGSGANVALGPATSLGGPGLDLYERAGVMTLYSLSGLLRGHRPELAADAVREVKDHPALLGYYLCDEPDHAKWNVPPAEIRAAHHVLKKADPDHLTLVLVMAWHRSMSFQYGDTADILASDPYSLTDHNKVVRTVEYMRDAAEPERPVIVVLQIGWDRTPKPRKLIAKLQAYAAITHGVDGILWFELQYARRRPEVKEWFFETSRELRALHAALGAPDAERQPIVSDRRVSAIGKDVGEVLVVISVNETEDDLGPVTLTIPGVTANRAEVKFERRSVRVAGGRIIDSFGPGQRHVYILKTGRRPR